MTNLESMYEITRGSRIYLSIQIEILVLLCQTSLATKILIDKLHRKLQFILAERHIFLLIFEMI